MYIDELLVAARTFSELIKLLTEIFSKLQNAGLTLNPDNTLTGVKTVKFLGHSITEISVKMLEETKKNHPRLPNTKKGKKCKHFWDS